MFDFERGAAGDLSAVGVPQVVVEDAHAVYVVARAAWRDGGGRG